MRELFSNRIFGGALLVIVILDFIGSYKYLNNSSRQIFDMIFSWVSILLDIIIVLNFLGPGKNSLTIVKAFILFRFFFVPGWWFLWSLYIFLQVGSSPRMPATYVLWGGFVVFGVGLMYLFNRYKIPYEQDVN